MLRRESDKNKALVNYPDITFGKLLGSGGFGEVYHGTWRHNDVAVKKLLLKNITPESAAEFETESQIMARLRSPNIVQFYGYAITPERCIVMEYCPNGSLFSVLHSHQPLEWSIRVKIALGTAKGLAFLHEERILHRDIKSLNILLTEHFDAKLTDFGLSKLKAETKSFSTASKTSNNSVGTTQWMAPELFSRRGIFTQKSDIYSLGVTFWELASKQIPFASAPSPEVIPMWVLQGEREDIPADCPPDFGVLIQQCWSGEPSARPDTNAIITQLKKSVEALSAQKTSKAPSPNPSPSFAPSGPQYFSNLVSEDAPKPFKPFKPLVFSPPAKPLPAPPIKQASPQAVATFVRLIAEGEQDEVEALLQKDRTLALLASDVTDLSERTFKGITGFQYAVWALDWHMWTMIRKYLPNGDARAQLQAIASAPWVKQHGQSVSWQNLLNAQQKFIGLCEKNQWVAADTCWQREVGGAQRLLPVHVVNEYCHPDHPFYPCPDFTKADPLPRTRKIDEGEWFTATYNGGKLGEKFGMYIGASGPRRMAEGVCGGHASDHKACHTLLATRTQQRDQLFAELNLGTHQRIVAKK